MSARVSRVIRDALRRHPDGRGLLDRVLQAVLPRLPAWLLPALGAVAVLGVLLIAWAVVT